MSNHEFIDITCPKCHSVGQYIHWQYIDTDSDADLREALLSGELFVYRCPVCGTPTYLAASCFYHDAKHRFLLSFDFARPEVEEPLPASILQAAGYTIRRVYGLRELCEKIRILENGLNDVPLERMKYTIAHFLRPGIAARGAHLEFQEMLPPADDHPFGKLRLAFDDADEGTTYTMDPSMELYHAQVLACDTDPRMKADAGECVDEQWIIRKLQHYDRPHRP